MAKSDEILKKATEILSSKAAEKEAEKMQLERERRELIASIGGEVADMLTPTLERIVQANQVNADMIRSIISEVKIEAPVIPEVKLPPINVPRPNVTVKAPEVRVPQMPEVKIPETVFPERMKVEMEGVDKMTPLPVMMMDTKGRPMSIGSGGGGRADFLTIKDIRDSSGASIINADGELKTSAAVSVGDVTVSQDYGSGEIGSETVRMVMATDAIASVNIVAGSSSGTEYNDGDTASTPAGAVAMGDTGEESGNIFAIALGSGAISSNSVRVVQASDATSSVNVTGGTLAAVTGITNSVAMIMEDGDGNTRTTFPIEGTLTDITNSIEVNQVSGAIWSTEAQLHGLDSSGAWEQVRVASGVEAGALRVVHATDAIASVNVVGNFQDATHDSSADSNGPQGMIEARTSNPTAVGNGDAVRQMGDDVGRAVMRPIQVRDLTATAYASITADAETTVLAGVASTFLDLVYVMGANQSDGAVTLDFACGAGGATVLSLEIPANSTAGVAPAMPLPMTEVAQQWVVNFADADTTGTTVDISALFSKEV